ncbi:MAG: hypothetical protein WDO68_26110 [Gammaproteobacteria bacterium]
MSARSPIDAGRVEWAGDNPGIYFKAASDGDWTRLALYFRVVLSPAGSGKAMFVLNSPDQNDGIAAGNVCITDNVAMVEYLTQGFIGRFPTFRNRPGLAAMSTLKLTSSETIVAEDSHTEIVRAEALSLKMVWTGLGPPFAVAVEPPQSATGSHRMYSTFREASGASIYIDDRALAGAVVSRPFFGISMSSAFLALSEIWISPAGADGK